jgi:hypothetical protein
VTPPSDAFVAGARLFDAGDHWAAHEAWEEHWRAEVDPAQKRFLQGLIQIAAGFHKLLVMRAPGPAVHLLEKGLAKLEPLPAGTDLGAFVDRVRAAARAIEAGTFDASNLPRLGAPLRER